MSSVRELSDQERLWLATRLGMGQRVTDTVRLFRETFPKTALDQRQVYFWRESKEGSRAIEAATRAVSQKAEGEGIAQRFTRIKVLQNTASKMLTELEAADKEELKEPWWRQLHTEMRATLKQVQEELASVKEGKIKKSLAEQMKELFDEERKLAEKLNVQ